MKSQFLTIICFVGLLTLSRAADKPFVELELRTNPAPVTESEQLALGRQALQLLESSNFHSGVGDKHKIFNLPDVQRTYRAMVAGKYLLVSYPTPQTVTTLGGKISVSQIIVGLNREDYASDLFTIDGSGVVVGHAKYSGSLCISILKAIKQLQR